ncbi:uncharacterized protein LOC118745637 [Rhagoletis pomonella]|uniref:uncharacterized protein LOC118745637 n=1 Tax=Rhagoletis pomonella TaxID=28610 RepID=UPI00177E4AD0|nr:uncharacterized protein LOC118745637 [Rhagoletis pomonella]
MESRATGGGSFNKRPISSLEDKVISLTGLETCTSGLQAGLSFGGRQVVEASSTSSQAANSQALATNTREEVIETNATENGSQIENCDTAPTPRRRRHIASTAEDIENCEIAPTPRRRRHAASTAEDSRNLLSEQISMQREFYKDQCDHNSQASSGLKRVYRGIEKLCEIEKEKLKEFKRHNAVKEIA